MKHAGYTIMDRVADSPLPPLVLWEAAGMPRDYPGMKVEKWYEFHISTFPGKQFFKAEKNRMLWNSVSKYAVKKLDLCDSDGVVGRYSHTKELLNDSLEEEGNVASSRAKTPMAVWLHGLAAALELEERYPG